MTLSKFLNTGIEYLKKKGINEAKDDATFIFFRAFNLTLEKYLSIKDINMLTLDNDVKRWDIKINLFNNMMAKRAKHTPLQYILNEQYFYNNKFYVDERVLIPRQDSEVLVEKVILDNKDAGYSLLDLCTGSGALGISIACNIDIKNLVLADISLDALDVCKINSELLNDKNTNIHYLKTDMFDNLDSFLSNKDFKTFDIITINPPYIKTSVIETLSSEVKDHEPILALDGGEDGVKFYNIIFEKISKYMHENTKVYMEIGFDEALDIKNIYDKYSFKDFTVYKDLNKNDRVVYFTK